MTPLERAARALYKLGDNGGWGPEDEDAQWHQHLPAAHAVLLAIREPSEAVRQAMRDNVPVDGYDWDHQERMELKNGTILDAHRDCWQAMIDAMLAEG